MQITISDTKILIAVNILLLIIIITITLLPKECPEQRNIEFRTKNPLDIQFSKENFPSNVHNDMFVQSTPWIGGYGLGIGKTYISTPQQSESNK